MKWPRGKYNNERLAGVWFKVRIDITWWQKPCAYTFGGDLVITLGPVIINAGRQYSFHDSKLGRNR